MQLQVYCFSGLLGNAPANPNGVGCEIKEIMSTEDQYLVAPELKIVSETGFGAYATCTVKDGRIDTVTIENKGVVISLL